MKLYVWEEAQMVFIVDYGLFMLILAILGIATGYLIISNLGSIVFAIVAIIAFFYGGYIFFTGFTKETIPHKIASCVNGLMMMTIFFYIAIMIDAATLKDDLSIGNYIIISHFDFLQKDLFVTSTIIGLILLEIAALPGQIKVIANVFDGTTETVLDVLSVLLVIAIYVGAFQITVKDNFNNNIGSFELSNPQYEVTQTTDVRNDDLFFIKTGSFKAGTKLYSDGRSTDYKDTEYIEATDGKQLGYVRAEDLKTLY